VVLKRRIYEILFNTRDRDVVGKTIALLLMALIFINVIAVMLETVEELSAYSRIFNAVEVVSVFILLLNTFSAFGQLPLT
jgi:ABC-type Na+ efflux pump permease subunit